MKNMTFLKDPSFMIFLVWTYKLKGIKYKILYIDVLKCPLRAAKGIKGLFTWSDTHEVNVNKNMPLPIMKLSAQYIKHV